MSQFYKILKADPLGEPWTPSFEGAKPTQNYWCQVEGEELAVSIGKQVPNTLVAGESVYGDLMKATSQKGTNYWKFKSAKVPEGTVRPASTPAQAQAQAATGAPINMSEQMPGWFMPSFNMLKYVYDQMREMDVNAPKDTIPLKPEVPAPTGVEQIAGDTPLSLEDKEMLDGIFGDNEIPEDVPTEEPTGEPEPEGK